MMRWLVESSLRARKGVVVAAAVLFGFGAWQLRQADMDALPEFNPPIVEVQTEALGLSAEEMEQLITVRSSRICSTAWRGWIRSGRSRCRACPRSSWSSSLGRICTAPGRWCRSG